MKYLKRFDEEYGRTIKSWCKKLDLYNFEINEDGSVDVYYEVNITGLDLSKIPIQFGYVQGYFHCDNNKIELLKNSPREIDESFSCSNNKIISLENGPIEVGEYYDCSKNMLTTLKEIEKVKIGGDFYCDKNPISPIYNIFGNVKSYIESLDYNYLRGTDIVRGRFMKACDNAGIIMPESVEGYNYV
jgi:hypothetical protein